MNQSMLIKKGSTNIGKGGTIAAIKSSSGDQATNDAIIIRLLAAMRVKKNFVARVDDRYAADASSDVNRLRAEPRKDTDRGGGV